MLQSEIETELSLQGEALAQALARIAQLEAALDDITERVGYLDAARAEQAAEQSFDEFINDIDMGGKPK